MTSSSIIVEVHHIDRECRAHTSRTFPVYWPDFEKPQSSDILASHTVQGEEAEALVKLMKQGLRGGIDHDLCGHYPDYGLRILRDDVGIFQTTICRTCANWIRIYERSAERYHADPGSFRALAEELQRLVPLTPR